MPTLAQIAIAIDARQAEQGAQQAERAVEKIIDTTRRAGESVEDLERRLNIDARPVRRRIDEVTREIDRVRRTSTGSDGVAALQRERVELLEFDRAVTGTIGNTVRAARAQDELARNVGRVGDAAGKTFNPLQKMDGLFGALLRRSPFILGADLVARVFGFRNSVDALNQALDAGARVITQFGERLRGITPDLKASEERLKKVNEQLAAFRSARAEASGETELGFGFNVQLGNLKENEAALQKVRGTIEKLRAIAGESRTTLQSWGDALGLPDAALGAERLSRQRREVERLNAELNKLGRRDVQGAPSTAGAVPAWLGEVTESIDGTSLDRFTRDVRASVARMRAALAEAKSVPRDLQAIAAAYDRLGLHDRATDTRLIADENRKWSDALGVVSDQYGLLSPAMAVVVRQLSDQRLREAHAERTRQANQEAVAVKRLGVEMAGLAQWQARVAVGVITRAFDEDADTAFGPRVKIERFIREHDARQELLRGLRDERDLLRLNVEDQEISMLRREGMARAIGMQSDALERYLAKLEAEGRALQKERALARMFEDIADAAARGLEDALMDLHNWRDAVEQVFLDVQRMALRLFVTSPFQNWLESFLKGFAWGGGGAFSGGGGGGGTGGGGDLDIGSGGGGGSQASTFNGFGGWGFKGPQLDKLSSSVDKLAGKVGSLAGMQIESRPSLRLAPIGPARPAPVMERAMFEPPAPAVAAASGSPIVVHQTNQFYGTDASTRGQLQTASRQVAQDTFKLAERHHLENVRRRLR